MRVQLIAQGSQGGLAAASRGHCDVAPVHLHDPTTGRYNVDFVPPGCTLVPGYGRMQGLVTRADERRVALTGSPPALSPEVLAPEIRIVNRNRGSGTRVLIDELRPAGAVIRA